MKSYKEIAEALKGKQHKIDKNKNGQIDAHDFKLLRKEETELVEATVKTQKYSWGTMKTVHHGADFSIPLHPEHHKEIAKLKDEQEHKFKTEDGKHWTARRKGDEVHFQGANNGGTTKVKHADLKESAGEDDEDRETRSDYKVSPSGRKTHKEIVFKHGEEKKEGIDEAAPPGFEGTVKAMKKKPEIDNPYALAWSMYKKGYKSHKKADGTMKEETIEEKKVPDATGDLKDACWKGYTAVGMKMKNGKKVPNCVPTNEEVEQIDEGIHKQIAKFAMDNYGAYGKKLGRYEIHKARAAVKNPSGKKIDYDKVQTHIDSMYKQRFGKEVKEEVEQIDEISSMAHAKYRDAARKDIKDNLPHTTGEYGDIAKNIIARRMKGLATSNAKTKIKEESKKDDPPFDPPYKTVKGNGTVTDKSGAKHTPMSRVRDLARTALKKQMKEQFELDITDEQADSVLDIIDEQAPVAPVPGQKWKDHAVMVHKDSKQRVVIQRKNAKNYPENEGWKEVSPGQKLKEDDESKFSYAELMMMIEGRAQYMVKLRHDDKGHTMIKTYAAEKGEDDYDIKRRAQSEHGRSGYSVDSVRKKETETYEADDENETNSTTQKRGRGRPAGSKSGARGPRIK